MRSIQPMKQVFTIILLASLVAIQPARAQSDANPLAELTSSQQAFMKLAEDDRVKFADHINEAMRFFQQKRIFETLEQVHEAKKIFDGSPELMNLEASCLVEIRNFERALEIYLEAEKLSPENPSIKFNIAEVYFVTRKWENAHERLTKLLTMVPAENVPFTRLIEFKILLTLLRLDRDDEAAILANKYDFLDDSPFHYYATAALAFEAGDTAKAEESIAISNRVFRDPNTLAPWQDTLVEFGHIKGFYSDNRELDD